MIPETIKFTGLEIDPKELIPGRCLKGVIPTHWTRLRFEIERSSRRFYIELLNRWLFANITGKWISNVVTLQGGAQMVIVAFESDTDAVMFRLQGGETAWNNPNTND